MAGLDILGGIGKGLMQGSQFIQQKNMQDEQLALQQAQQADNRAWREQHQARLDEDQQFQRQDRTRLEAERQKTADYQALFQETAAELGPDASPEQLGAEVLKRGLSSGKIPQTEVAPLLQSAAKMRQLGITNAFRRGDVAELGRIMSGPQQYGRPVRMELAQGKDEFGQPSNRYRVVDEADGKTLADFSPLQLGSILGADDILAEKEAIAKGRKTQSEIRENEAQADAARALATQRRQAPAGGHNAAPADPTRGFSATSREEARRVALEHKAANGTATPEELDLLGVLQQQAKQRGAGYTPPEARKAQYWRDAPPDQVEAEVERQLAGIRMQAKGDPFLQQQLQDPATLDVLRGDIRRKLGVRSGAQGNGPHPVLGDAGQQPQATNQGQPVAAPGQRRPLDSFFSR